MVLRLTGWFPTHDGSNATSFQFDRSRGFHLPLVGANRLLICRRPGAVEARNRRARLAPGLSQADQPGDAKTALVGRLLGSRASKPIIDGNRFGRRLPK